MTNHTKRDPPPPNNELSPDERASQTNSTTDGGVVPSRVESTLRRSYTSYITSCDYGFAALDDVQGTVVWWDGRSDDPPSASAVERALEGQFVIDIYANSVSLPFRPATSLLSPRQ